MNVLHLTTSAPSSNLLYAGTYDPVLVGLSVAAAMFASYAGLLVSQQVANADRSRVRNAWTLVGAMCLGLGIWTMHFVGMLAFSLPCSSSYDAADTLLSTIPAILSSLLAIRIISGTQITLNRLMSGGLLIGAGIGVMHYVGMSAMHLDGVIIYNAWLFTLSLLVAVALASLALWIRFRVLSWNERWIAWANPVGAMVLGVAVSGMHYTAMAATYFIQDANAPRVPDGISPAFLSSIVLGTTGSLIVVTIVATYLGGLTWSPRAIQYRLVMALVTAWGVVSWLSSGYYYDRLALDYYVQELSLANQQAREVAENFDERLQLIKAIALMGSLNDSVSKALLRSNHNRANRNLTYENRKRHWSTDDHLVGLNRYLIETKKTLRVDEIYIVDAEGYCISSSNADSAATFVGSDFSDRQYFTQSRRGFAGKQYAMGRVSKIAGLYYSTPVIAEEKFIGAVVVKRDIENLRYLTSQSDTMVADENGVIILASDKSLEFLGIGEDAVSKLSAEQRFIVYGRSSFDKLSMISMEGTKFPQAYRINARSDYVAHGARTLPDDAITIHTTRSLSGLTRFETERRWLFFLLVASGGTMILASAGIVFYLRQARRSDADLRIAATAFESQQGLMVTDAARVILRVNKAFTQITGFEPHEAVGKTPSLLHSGRQDAEFYAQMNTSLMRDGIWQGEIWNRRKNAEVFPAWLSISEVRDKEGLITHYVGACIDLTDHKSAENQIKSLAFYDPLTGLPNRRLMLDRLQKAVGTVNRNLSNSALLYVDLDNFKTLNDTLGHRLGDLLLEQVGERISSCVRESDTAARVGSDEFVVLLEGLSAKEAEAAVQAEAVGEKILKSLALDYRLGEHDYRSSSSIGITLFGVNLGEELQEPLKRAELAMFQAKAAGRNAMRFFNPKMQAEVIARASLEADLRLAIEGEQFAVFYQAQVVGPGRLTGAEALVRWLHPSRGVVSPAEFIPLAEDTGLILQIGRMVLESACQTLADWANVPELAKLTISVNVSAKQIHHQDFVAEVLGTLDRIGATPKLLKLELTESLLVNEVENVISKMALLQTKGVGFSLDDFGTGYSSLTYLKRLPLDQLKIDQSFIRNVLVEPNDAAIAKMVIALADSLGLTVIAEGVELEAQRDFLARHGCHAYQGYLFSRPLPVGEFVSYALGSNSSTHTQISPN